MTDRLVVYIDYKSPYAYLAKDPARALAAELGMELEWRPYTLQIPRFLGSVEERNDHQWRRVKYSYMDARRLANERGLIVLGPKKIFDSTVSHVGLLYARDAGVVERYNDLVFERFFKRELDIEDADSVAAVIGECGADPAGFRAFLQGEGRSRLQADLSDAEERLGVFGVPTFVVGDEIFWGGDRIPQVRARVLRDRAG